MCIQATHIYQIELIKCTSENAIAKKVQTFLVKFICKLEVSWIIRGRKHSIKSKLRVVSELKNPSPIFI